MRWSAVGGKLLCGFAAAVLLVTVARAGGPLSVTIDARRASASVTPYEYGMFIEPIGGLIARTLWAEMLDDRKFFYPIVVEGMDAPVPPGVEGRRGFTYRRWRPIGGSDAVVMDKHDPYVGRQCASVVVEDVAPRGFGQSGIGVAKGKRYKGHLLLSGDVGVRVQVELIWGAGPDQRQAVVLPAPGPVWRDVLFEFTAGADSTDARLEITGVRARRDGGGWPGRQRKGMRAGDWATARGWHERGRCDDHWLGDRQRRWYDCCGLDFEVPRRCCLVDAG